MRKCVGILGPRIFGYVQSICEIRGVSMINVENLSQMRVLLFKEGLVSQSEMIFIDQGSLSLEEGLLLRLIKDVQAFQSKRRLITQSRFVILGLPGRNTICRTRGVSHVFMRSFSDEKSLEALRRIIRRYLSE